jgi:hypothetical protein
MGARLEATQVGGGSHPEERHGMVVEVHKIDRRQKPGTEGFWINNFRTQYLLRSGDSVSGFDQPLLQSVPNYRQVAKGMVPRVIVTAPYEMK